MRTHERRQQSYIYIWGTIHILFVGIYVREDLNNIYFISRYRYITCGILNLQTHFYIIYRILCYIRIMHIILEHDEQHWRTSHGIAMDARVHVSRPKSVEFSSPTTRVREKNKIKNRSYIIYTLHPRTIQFSCTHRTGAEGRAITSCGVIRI